MNTEKSIRFLVDEPVAFESKGMIGRTGIESLVSKSINVSVEAFQASLGKTIGSILELLSNIPLESEKCEVSEATFCVNIDASGEISVVSTAKATLAGKTGMEFKIVRKKDPER
jgi:hypothetical protein